MFETVIMVILAIIAIIAFAIAAKGKNLIAGLIGVGSVVGVVITLLASTLFFQSQGQAKVIVNADGTIAGQSLQPGTGWKAPWQSFVEYDLFSQEVVYAGGGDSAPSYTGGTVNGKEVTVAVGGISGGSTQANVDISITYTLDADKVTELYKQYKTQERFTKQVIEKTILSTIREVPAQYNAIEFRGEKRAEATDQMLKALNDKLNPNGVTVDFVNLQDITYSESVEEALTKIEQANQAVQEAEAKQRQKVVDAETKRIEAQGEADAIAIRNSQAPNANVLEQLRIEALHKAAEKGSLIVVPEGSSPLVQVQR